MIAAVSRADRADRAAPALAPGPVPTLIGRGDGRVLDRYRAPDGSLREVVRVAAAGGSALVIDCAGRGAGDARLVAHLAADEPDDNAAVACACYLAERRSPTPCSLPRPVCEDDVRRPPLPEPPCPPRPEPAITRCDLVDEHGARHRLAVVAATSLLIPEVRWLREPALGACGPARIVSVRDVTGALQDYEPVRMLSTEAIRRHHDDERVSVTALRAELARVAASPIVLNRRLREHVAQMLVRDGVSMSEIALRCGRVKRDRRGNVSGETSWLARRLGLLPEGGERVPTPWIHSEVLALIARRGLGLCPREVEL